MTKANGFTRREIMNAIKIHGPMTADELATMLGISAVAVRQHVGTLESEGYIDTKVERRGLGRPVHRYGLTSEGDETFPRHYDRVALTLLDEVRALFGEDAVDEVLAGRRKRAAGNLQARLEGLPPRARIAQLVDIQNEAGYMVRLTEQGDDLILREHNCPICLIAKNYPSACRQELELFREVLGPDCTVVAEEHQAAGARSCAYRIHVKDTCGDN